MAVFPDHLPYSSLYKELFILFPGMKKVDPKYKVKGEITYYDFAPTILDLIGIKKYFPQFPYGRSIYHLENSTKITDLKRNKPLKDDFPILFKYLHFKEAQNRTF